MEESFRFPRWTSLAFDPTKSRHYKVVCVRPILESISRRYQRQIEMYSPDTESWRICIGPFTITSDAKFENGVYSNGSIHWLSDEFRRSLYFKMDTQTLGSMQMPNITPLSSWDCITHCYFEESCGHLHYIGMRSQYIQFDVHEMKSDYSEWYVKYKVDISPPAAVHPEMSRCSRSESRYSILSVVWGRESGGDSFLDFHIPGKVIRFNLVSKTAEILHEFQGGEMEDDFRHYSVKGFQYIESICCV